MTFPNPYVGIFGPYPRQAHLMARPGAVTASKRLIQIIEDAQRENPTPEGFADWLANFMEGYGALFAKPVFDLDGNGPSCSFCGMAPWPFCGHHHMSAEAPPATTGHDTKEKNS